MKKEAFLERLEALLQDIPEEEKRDAIDYYRDYLEEAGPEKEEEVLAEFQSPEHIAEVIRTELQSEWSGGEFTDRGYNDSRFEEKRTTLSRSGGAEQGEREKEAGFQAGTEDAPFREFRDEETGENAASNENQRSRLSEMLHCLKEKITGFQDWNGCGSSGSACSSSIYLFAGNGDCGKCFWAGSRTGSDIGGAGTDDGAGVCWRNYAVCSGYGESV